MGQVATIAKREMTSMFYSPIAYVAISAFLFVMGIIFAIFVFHPSAISEMRYLFIGARYVLFLVVPLTTMGLFSEEFKTGRMEMLRTSPLSPSSLVIGKFIGGLAFCVVIIATILLHVLLLAIFGGPDYRAVAASFLGLMLLGSMYVSIGLFFSACTQDQLVAAVGTLITLGLMNLIGDVISWFGDRLPIYAWIKTAATQATVGVHLEDFSKGIVDVVHAVYFVSVAAFFVFLTYLVLESRNWRR